MSSNVLLFDAVEVMFIYTRKNISPQQKFGKFNAIKRNNGTTDGHQES